MHEHKVDISRILESLTYEEHLLVFRMSVVIVARSTFLHASVYTRNVKASVRCLSFVFMTNTFLEVGYRHFCNIAFPPL